MYNVFVTTTVQYLLQYYNSLNYLDLCHVRFVYNPRPWGVCTRANMALPSVYTCKHDTPRRNLNTHHGLQCDFCHLWNESFPSNGWEFLLSDVQVFCLHWSDECGHGTLFMTCIRTVSEQSHSSSREYLLDLHIDIYKDVASDWMERQSLSREDS
jgi:hypothetical protein